MAASSSRSPLRRRNWLPPSRSYSIAGRDVLIRIVVRLRSFSDQRIVSVAAMPWPCMWPQREPPLSPSNPAAGLCPPSKKTRAA